MSEVLLKELRQFVEELERKEASTFYAVPPEDINAVSKAKSLEKLLHEIFTQVSGKGGIHLQSIIRREFGMRAETMDRFDRWAPYSKDQFEEELHDAVDRAEIRAGNQGVFFGGTPSKQEAAEALQLLKDIAHSAIRCQFQPKRAGADVYVDILEKLLKFVALPNTYPEGNEVTYRNLISSDRLCAMCGGDPAATEALKAYARMWYQQSPYTFLERMEGYFSYEYVREYLYALTEEQQERLSQEYLRHIKDEFTHLKGKPNLHRARQLTDMLETVLSWETILPTASTIW